MERDDVVIVATVVGHLRPRRPGGVPRADGHAEGRREARGATTSSSDLVAIQYQRNDVAFERGTFRVRGDTVEIFPAYEEQAVRIELWGDAIERITKIHPLTGETIAQLDRCAIYPAKHFVTAAPHPRAGASS